MVAVCHCSTCRRAAGAPAVAWAMFALDELRFLRAEPARYASSPGVERGFCGRCGTTLTFTADVLPGWWTSRWAASTIPRPSGRRCTSGRRSRLPWLALADDLPRHAELPPQA